MIGLVLLLIVVGLSMFGAVYLLARLRQERTRFVETLPDSVVQVNLLDNDDAVIVAEGRGRLVFANPRAKKWFNLNGGEPDLELIVESVQPSETFLELFSKEGQASFRIGARRVEATSHYVPHMDTPQMVIVLREIASPNAGREMLDPAEAMRAVSEITALLNAQAPTEETLNEVLRVLGTVIAYDVAEINLWDQDLQQLTPKGRGGERAYFEMLENNDNAYGLDDSCSGWITRYRQPLLISDTRLRPDVHPKIAAFGIRSLVGTPMLLNNRVVGTIELASKARIAFDHEDMALLQAVGGQVALAVENARLSLTQSERLAELSGLQQIASVMTSLRDPRQMYGQLTSRIALLADVEMCGILLEDPVQQLLVGQPPFYGVPEAIISMYRISLAEDSPARLIYHTRDWWYTNNALADDIVQQMGLSSLASAVGVRQTALVQLSVGGRRFGVIQVANKNDNTGFNEQDMRLLSVFASQTAIVVENARLYEEERRRSEELGSLQQVSQAVGALHSPEELYSYLNERIAKLMNCQMCGILLYDEAGNQLVSRPPFFGVEDDLIRHYRIVITPGTTFHKLYTESGYWISNELRADPVLRDSGLDKLAMLIGVRQTMMVPLSIGGRRLGVVQVSNRLDNRDFTDEDARVLSIFAAQAAVILENSRLYREMRERTDESDSLRRIAEAASSTLPLTEVIKVLVTQTQALFAAEVCAVALMDDRTGELTIRPEWTAGISNWTESITIDTYRPGYQQTVAVARRPFLSNNLRSDPRVLPLYREIAERFGFATAIQAPLIAQDRSYGEITVANRTAREFTTDDLRLLQTIAAQLAAAVDRQKLYQATDADLRIRIRELDALTRISYEQNRTTEFDRLMEVIRTEAARTTNADYVTIVLLKPNEDWDEQISTPVFQRRFGPIKGLSGGLAPIELRAITAQDLIAIDDYATAGLAPLPADARSAIAAPITYSEQIVGVLHFASQQVGAFPVHTQDFAKTLVNQIAISLGNEERYQEQLDRAELLKQRGEQLTQIFELGRMLSSGEDIETVLEAVAHAISDSVGFKIVVMSLVDRRLGVTRRVAQSGLTLATWNELRAVQPKLENLDRLLQPRYRISNSYFLPGEDPTWQTPDLPVGSVATLPTASQSTNNRQWKREDLLLVPLRNAEGELIGLISVDDPRNGLRPSLRTIEALETLAYQAALAIVNSQLLQAYKTEAEAVGRERDRLEQLYVVAGELQRASGIESRLQIVAESIRNAGWRRVAITLRDANLEPQEIVTAGFTPEDDQRFRQNVLSGQVWAQRLADPEFRQYRLGGAYLIRVSDPWVTENKLMAGLNDPNIVAGASTLRIPTVSPRPSDDWHPLDTIYLPLYGLDRSRLIGIIQLDTPNDGLVPSESSLRPIELFAAQAALALENVRLYREMASAAQQEAQINEVMEAITSTLDLNEIIEGVANGFQQMIPFQRMHIALLDGGNSPDARFRISRITIDMRGDLKIEEEAPFPVANTAMGLATSEGVAKVYALQHEETRDTYTDLNLWFAEGERTALVVPMVAGGRAVGALHMGSTLANAYGFQESLDLVSRVANLTAIAIENAQLLQQTIDRERFSLALSRVGQSVNTSLNMASVLGTICEESLTILNVSGAYVWLLQGDEIVGLSGRGPGAEEFIGQRIPLSDQTVLGVRVIQQGTPQVVDIQRQEGHDTSSEGVQPLLPPETNVHAMLGVPMLREGRAIGALTFIQTDATRPFTSEDVEKATAFAVQAAVAIENARLYQETLGLTSFNQAVIQSIQQGIIVVDRDLRVRTANAYMRHTYGWDDNALGEYLFDYRPFYRDALEVPLARALETGELQTRFDVSTQIGSTSVGVRNYYVYPLREGETITGAVILVEDVTERYKLEADLKRSNEQLNTLTEVSGQLASLLEPGEIAERIFDHLSTFVAYDRGTLWIRRGDRLIIAAARGFPDDSGLYGIEAEIADSELFREIASRGQVLNIPDIRQDSRFPMASEQSTRSWLGVSLVSRGKLNGLLVLESDEVSFYTPQMAQLALTYANQAAVALENAQLLQDAQQAAATTTELYKEANTRAAELDQQARRLSLLYRVSNALTQTLDTEDIFEVALREMIDLLGVDRGSAFLFMPEAASLQLVIEYPRGEVPPDETAGIAVSANPLINDIRRTLLPVAIPNALHDSRTPLASPLHAEPPILSQLVTPLTVSGQIIGLMTFDALNEPVDFRPNQIEVAQTIASQAAIAIQNANLLEQSLARTRELETLFEATQSISATLNFDEVLNNVAQQMIGALNVDGCKISTWDPDGRELKVGLEMSNDGVADERGARYPLSEYPTLERALNSRQMILIRASDASLRETERVALRRRGAASVIVIPMTVHDQAIGLIELEVHSPMRSFSGTEVRLARTLAAQAAVGIENARLQTETATKLVELFTLNDLSNQLAATMDEAQTIKTVRAALPTLIRAQTLLLALLSEDGEQVSYPIALRGGAAFPVAPHPLGDDEVSFIIRSRAAQRLVGEEIDSVLRNQGAQQRLLNSQCLLGVPLVAGETVVGALVASDSDNPRAFKLDDLRILSTVGAQLATAIQNTRLFERTRRFNAELEARVQERTEELQRERDSTNFLYQITTSLTASLDIGTTLNRTLGMLAETLNADMGVVLAIDTISDGLVVRARYNMPYREGDMMGYTQREGLAGWVIQTQQPVVVADVQEDYRWVKLTDFDSVPRAAIVTLLEANDEIQGVVMLFNRQPNHFSQEQIPLVAAAATQMANAMNNADLYALIREQAERLSAMVRREQVDSTKNLAIVESIADGVMVANQDGDITQFNSAAEAILGLPRQQVINNHISVLSGLYAATGGRSWLEAIEEWIEDPASHRPGEAYRTQVELETGKIVSITLAPVNMGDQFLGTVSVFRDVTREVEVDRMKSEFVATVSHELRTPMTSIKGYADLLLLGAAGPINDMQQRFLSTVKANADRLSILVNELLDISRIDRGVIKLNFGAVNFAEVLQLTLRHLQDRITTENKRIDVQTNVPEGLPTLRADFDKITQVMTHLVNNAFNYTHTGGTITIAAQAEQDTVLITVKDTGVGIPKEKQAQIWNRFYRDEDERLVMESSGAGLGLSIVKEYVTMHDGEVWLESDTGQGTTFYLRIPAYIAETQA
jgi:PAS domain S-box-containing protein